MQLEKAIGIAGTKILTGGKKKKEKNYITWISRLLPLIIIERNNIREHKPALTEHDLKELSPKGC